jgi:hypothetical protein
MQPLQHMWHLLDVQPVRYVQQPVRYMQQPMRLTVHYLPDHHTGDRARSRGRTALSIAEGHDRAGRCPRSWRHASRHKEVHRASVVCS